MTDKLSKMIEERAEKYKVNCYAEPTNSPYAFKAGAKAGIALLLQSDEFKGVVEALKISDSWWFDPDPKDREGGACSACDVNLHENCMGQHKQLDGDPCPFQASHDALTALKELIGEMG